MKTTRRHFLTLIAIGALPGSILVGCGKDQSVSIAPASTAPPTLAAAKLTITVRAIGGFRVWGSETSSQSTFVVRDGTLFQPGPVPAIYPGPALVPVMKRELTDDQLSSLRTKLSELKLLGPPVNLGAPNVADVPDTLITITDGDTTYTHQIPALEMDVFPDDDDDSIAKNRQRDAMQEWVGNPLSEVTPLAGVTVVFDRFRISAQRQDRVALDNQFADQPMKWREVPWPVATGLIGEQIECRDLDGSDAATFGPVIAAADQLTYFSSGNDVYQLAARGLLPGEPGCDELGPSPTVSP